VKCTAATFREGKAFLTPLILRAILVLQLYACGAPAVFRGVGNAVPETTYEKFLLLAEAGDAESQNVIGFMLFHGEGVGVDRVRAEMWFRQAAEQGNVRGQRNLAVMYSMGSATYGTDSEREPAASAAQGQLSGEELYGRFCAGCHGFNGIARYVHSPSFALDERLEKGDAELMRSLLHGKGEMPNWDDKLSRAELEDILRFVRVLRLRYEAGISHRLRAEPSLYYLFGPMQWRAPESRPPVR
jgi:mono/diheme cytochrome c family protein